MWKLHRYYLKEVTISSILTFSVLFGVVLISVVYRGIDRAQGFGIWAIAKTTMFMAADTIPHLLSISLLFATVLCFARASQDKEITAIRSAGISP
ncbi:MAG: LptF/LptG family permease, partial [Planctomycetota bacterium]